MDDDPDLRIAVCWQSRCRRVDDGVIERVVRSVLDAEGCTRAELSIAIIDDAEMAALHAHHLDKSGPTDVLTFDLADAAEIDAGGLDGEVVVSAETAARVSASAGHDADAELLLYIAHGLLHLLGYDDQDPAEADAMRRRQHALVTALGFALDET
ncbi:MAG TPA: rRNA maturation RNase YbeY [Mycobacterium sp.]|jgi:probable rRNA maturation factor